MEELDDPEQEGLHYFFHSLIGPTSNDALARVITRRLSERPGVHVETIDELEH